MTMNMNKYKFYLESYKFLSACSRSSKIFSDVRREQEKKSFIVNKTTCLSSDNVILDCYSSTIGRWQFTNILTMIHSGPRDMRHNLENKIYCV
jgi:hypothetical protein